MFDPIYEFLAKLGYTHPIHPTEVHMPIGLVVASLVFIYIAVIFRRHNLEQTVRHCIILAFIWIFPTMLFGYMDWQHFYAGAWLFPIKVKLATATLLAVLLLLAVIVGHQKGPTSKAAVTLYTLCFLAVVVLGYFGGQLVYGIKGSSAPTNYSTGRKIFATNCSACHPNGTNAIMPNLPLKGSAKLDQFKTFLAFLRDPTLPHGKPGPMPVFPPSKISDSEANELYEYITHELVK
jgi:mono/diheme cytochrome c family protein